MKTKIAAIAALSFFSAFALPSFAGDAAAANADKVYALKDGGSLYVFKDGKMAQTNKFGNTIFLQPGQAIETADGQKITASGNEVARLNSLLQRGHQN
jgi:Copper resistance protein K